eukprot:Skav236416  [mRNA]  locus=scaffold4540:76989:78262:- [translate_table: standard]
MRRWVCEDSPVEAENPGMAAELNVFYVDLLHDLEGEATSAVETQASRGGNCDGLVVGSEDATYELKN